ncbi:MAG: hypothetical protein ACRD0Q_04325 [Acidimicrobiales bacterium]
MFVQVITADVVNAEGLERQLRRWDEELRPTAVGFLGGTSGVTSDGKLIALARFESAEAADINSERPEQAAWWVETEKCLADVAFQNSTQVTPMRGGGSNDAGFVQVMRGHVLDAEKMARLMARSAEFEAALAEFRPDVIGDITVVHPDGSYTNAVYFTSQAEARANESKEQPAEMAAMFEEWMSAVQIDEFLDLERPRLV